MWEDPSPPGPCQTTLEETLVDMGVAVMHTLEYTRGTDVSLPPRLQKSAQLDHPPAASFGFSPTHTRAR